MGEVLRPIEISESAARTIRERIVEAGGCEVCGFLCGGITPSSTFVTSARPCENIYHATDRFAISGQDYLAALGGAEPNRRVVGVYHTHYGSAQTSVLDRHSIRLSPLVWVIIGISQEVIGPMYDWKAFGTLSTGRMKEIRVSLLKGDEGSDHAMRIGHRS
jgi:proteasome lid subunit RPN8/RPN11